MKFSIPYNGSAPDDFISRFLPYEDQIHSFYFGLPGVFISHSHKKLSAEWLLETTQNTNEFIKACKGRFNTILCINSTFYPDHKESLMLKLARELPVLIDHGLSAINIASPSVAMIIHTLFPTLEIQTSCNTFGFLNGIHKYWHEEFGTTVFNLPREAMRTPWLLDKFKETGFTSKCIVNDGCLYCCPSQVEHTCADEVTSKRTFLMFCKRPNAKLEDIFKTNFIPPHRLGEFEGRLDIAKLAGRWRTTDSIEFAFKAYLNKDRNAKLFDVFHGCLMDNLKNKGVVIYAKDWPKKTLTCESKECNTCDICEKAMEHIIKRSQNKKE